MLNVSRALLNCSSEERLVRDKFPLCNHPNYNYNTVGGLNYNDVDLLYK